MQKRILLIGGLILAGIGYCIKSCYNYRNRMGDLENKLRSSENITEKKIDLNYLIEYLKENREREFYGIKEKTNFEKIWGELSSETRWRIIKEIAASKAKGAYSGIKEKTVESYEELKEFFKKKVIDDGNN